MPKLYLALAIVGAILPWAAFFGLFGSAPLPEAQFWLSALYVNVGTAATFTDLAISCLAFWVFVFAEGGRLGMGHRWVYVLVTCFIGLSCALPLFLYNRARAIATA